MVDSKLMSELILRVELGGNPSVYVAPPMALLREPRCNHSPKPHLVTGARENHLGRKGIMVWLKSLYLLSSKWYVRYLW